MVRQTLTVATGVLHSWSGGAGLAVGATIGAKRYGVRRVSAALPLASLLAGGAGSKLPVPKAGASSRTPERLRRAFLSDFHPPFSGRAGASA